MTLPFLAYPPIEHEVGGVICKFYPINGRMVFATRGLLKSVSKSIAALFMQGDNDVSIEQSKIKAGDNEQQRTSQTAISSELAKLRFDQRQLGIENLVEGLTSDPSSRVIADIIMASMKDYYPRGSKTADQFLDETPAPVLAEMIAGVMKANARIFDPLKKRVEEITSILKSRLDQLRPQPASSESPIAPLNPETTG